MPNAMRRDFSGFTLDELKAERVKIRAALSAAAANGVVDYGIGGRSGKMDFAMLVQWEKDINREIDRQSGKRRGLKRAVPVDDPR